MMSWCKFSESAFSKRLIAAVFAFIHLSCVHPAAMGDESLRSDLGDIDLDPIWLYDDWESAKAAAQKSGRPIFVVFR